MFIVYALVVTFCLMIFDFLFIKTFQLENYSVKNYVKKAVKFDFAFGSKNKLIFTKRAKRLVFADFLLNLAVFLLIFGLAKLWVAFVLSALVLILSPLFAILKFCACQPMEEVIKKAYINKAKKKLAASNCKKIGITGSFGKTSTKIILYQILREEFDVCATPKSFNTPMGVCKTVLEELKETDDFFIVEMGARRKGDIEFLSRFVGVDFGIITPVGNCHLQTFGSLQNIEDTKYELCENCKDLVVFNGKSKSTKKLYQRFPHKKYLVCDYHGFAYAKNIKTRQFGSEFTLVIDKKELVCRTVLLGKANIDNIVVAATMAYLLGESLFSIKKGIEKLQPIPHRLELISGQKVKIIDDSYNSNFQGFMQALGVLSAFKGRKIVVSPGIVELGSTQEEENYKIAAEVARVADEFVIMNKTNKTALSNGARNAGMPLKNIHFATTRQEQAKLLKELLQEGDVVLFENDLPDNFK